MKTKNLTNLRRALLVAVSVALAPLHGGAQTVPAPSAPAVPPPQAANAPAANLTAPAREVVKLSAAGMSDDVIKAYIANSQSTFNLTPDNLVHLQGVGVSSPVMAAMLTHDNEYRANAAAYAAANTPPTAPPTAPYPVTPPADSGYEAEATSPSVSVYYTQPAYDNGGWYYASNYGWYWEPVFGWGGFGWCWFPSRGWCWFPRSHFGFRNGFAGNRFDGRFNHFGGNRFVGNHFTGNRFNGGSFNHFDHGNNFGRPAGVTIGHSFGASPSFHSVGGGMGHTGGGHFSGMSGGHSGGMGGGHSGGMGGGRR